MHSPLDRAEHLATQLLVQRSSPLETELCRHCRSLGEAEKLAIVLLLAERNVRLAGDVAARSGLRKAQQVALLEHILEAEQSNALKHLTEKLFARRLGEQTFLAVLQRYREVKPTTVSLAAFYFLASSKESTSRSRAGIKRLFEETRIAV